MLVTENPAMSTPPLLADDLRRLPGVAKPLTSVALGCWPMAGVTTLGATHADGVATVHAALDAGVTHFDTAYVYGPDGESDRILAEALAGHWDEVVVASKVGIHFEPAVPGEKRTMAGDARPETLRRECETLLGRLGIDVVDLLYLHSPDRGTPLAESAGALAELMAEGKTRSVGVSNCSLDELREFAEVCPVAAVQLPYNMLQRDIERQTVPWCRERGIVVAAYWPLMKGLLAGQIGRHEALDQGDSRRGYPMYQGDEWQKNQDFVDELRLIAGHAGKTVAQLVVNWTLSQAGITTVLCGAKRPGQIAETAGAMGWRLGADEVARIEGAIGARGAAAAKRIFA
jgi:aryl-alcohol dehydrogenase-like predicted oxidoreductase